MAVNSGSTPSLKIEFFDKTGLPYAPATFSYRIDDMQSGNAVRASTPLLADKVVLINLTASDTAHINPTILEMRRIVWIADAGLPQQETGDYFLEVRNVG